MFVDQPPPAAHQTVAAPLSAATRQAFLRNFRTDFPTLRGMADVQVLDAAQRIVDAAASRPRWALLHAQTQVLYDVDGPLASQVLSLMLNELAPGWTPPDITPPPGR